nr:PhF00039.1 [Neoporphyra haitanensis]
MRSLLSWGGGASPVDCRGCSRLAGAAAAATAATMVVVVGAAVTLLAAPAAAGRAAFSPAVRDATAATGRAAAANASADPITKAWEADLRGRAIESLPPLPSAELFRRHDGYFTLYAGRGLAAGQVLLEIPEALLDVPFALAAEPIAWDASIRGLGRRMRLFTFPPDLIYAFRLAPDTSPPTLELYRPPLSERSVDPDSVPGRQALAGISATTLLSFPARRARDGRLLIDARPWVAAAFNVGGLDGLLFRFVSGAARPTRVALTVNVDSADSVRGTVKFTVVGLPRRRMAPRHLDDRVGYFASGFTWIDDYSGSKAAPQGAYINKWDLKKNPVLIYYVDPSVPRAFWPAVVDGITRWNPAFAAAGHQRPVLQAVVPTDSDWPADYAVDDARFNTVSFVPDDVPSATGGTKSDPRTGEILNADIIFHDDLVREFVNLYRVWHSSGEEEQVASRAEVASVGAASILDTPSTRSSGRRVAGSLADFVYQFLAYLVAHEVGHSLGLRHNFRGSTGIPWSQLTNDTYVAMHGLSTSVMDYLPVGPLPRAKDGTLQRYFVSPVLGAYDVAAIRYGYTDWRSEDEARAFAASVAASGLAFGTDSDHFGETDALTRQFDFSATPLRWHRHIVRTAGRRLRRLARTAGTRPTTSAADTTADFHALLFPAVDSIVEGARLVGASVTDRRRTGGKPAVTPLDAATEAAAARWVLSQLDPADGLLSAATVATVAPHLLTGAGPGCFGDHACIARAAPAVASTLHEERALVLSALLSPWRLARLAANAAATAAAGDDPHRRMSVAGLLAALSDTFFGARWAHLRPPAAVTGAALFRAEAQARWVGALKALAAPAADAPRRPAAVALAAAGELARLAAAVAAAVSDVPESAHLRGLRLETAAFVVA